MIRFAWEVVKDVLIITGVITWYYYLKDELGEKTE